jgi:hypothetical protein
VSGLGAQAWLTRVTFVDLVHGAKYGGGEGERAATCLTDLLAHTPPSFSLSDFPFWSLCCWRFVFGLYLNHSGVVGFVGVILTFVGSNCHQKKHSNDRLIKFMMIKSFKS